MRLKACKNLKLREKTMIELKSITKDNLEDVLNLNVLEYQQPFVSSTACSLMYAAISKRKSRKYTLEKFFKIFQKKY